MWFGHWDVVWSLGCGLGTFGVASAGLAVHIAVLADTLEGKEV